MACSASTRRAFSSMQHQSSNPLATVSLTIQRGNPRQCRDIVSKYHPVAWSDSRLVREGACFEHAHSRARVQQPQLVDVALQSQIVSVSRRITRKSITHHQVHERATACAVVRPVVARQEQQLQLSHWKHSQSMRD